MRPLLTLVLLALLAAPAASAQPATAADVGALLDTRFDGARGEFWFDHNMILFPPPGLTQEYEIEGGYVVRDASGAVVSRHTIREATPDTRSRVSPDVMAWLVTRSGVPGDGQGEYRPGTSYTLDLDLYGETIGSVPFTVRQTSNGDPYNPVSELVLVGPWQTHAYFLHKTDRPDQPMEFHAWIGSDETSERTEVSIRRGGREVAFGPGASANRQGDPRIRSHQEFRLYTAAGREDDGAFRGVRRNADAWTIEDVTPGPYEVVLSTEAGPFRTMTIVGADGAFVPHPRSAIDYEPRRHFLTPRRPVDTLYWIAPAE